MPEWLQKFFPSDDPAILWRVVGGEKTSWEKKGFSEKTKLVCRGCNNGWMSRLEDAAKDVLSPAIARTDLPCALDLRSQLIAAQWAMKTCYVFQGQAPEPIAPMNRPPLLYFSGRPPLQASVFIGSSYLALTKAGSARYAQKPLGLVFRPDDVHLKPVPEFGYLAYLSIGGISFLIIEHRFENHVEVTLGEHAAKMFLKIWPLSSRTIAWPPEVMTDMELISPLFFDADPPGFRVEIFPV